MMRDTFAEKRSGQWRVGEPTGLYAQCAPGRESGPLGPEARQPKPSNHSQGSLGRSFLAPPLILRVIREFVSGCEWRSRID